MNIKEIEKAIHEELKKISTHLPQSMLIIITGMFYGLLRKAKDLEAENARLREAGIKAVVCFEANWGNLDGLDKHSVKQLRDALSKDNK